VQTKTARMNLGRQNRASNPAVNSCRTMFMSSILMSMRQPSFDVYRWLKAFIHRAY